MHGAHRRGAHPQDPGAWRWLGAPRGRWLTGMVSISAVGLMLSGCSTAPAHTSTPTPSLGIISVPAAAPTPLLSGASITVAGCCTATVPSTWSAAEPAGGGQEESSDPTGRLTVSWQVVGAARQCPIEPAALVDNLTSPTHPSGDVITGVVGVPMHGRPVTVYVTAPSNPAEHNFQFLSADAVVGSHCIAIGAAEYGAASAANLHTLLAILATTSVPVFPSAPPTP